MRKKYFIAIIAVFGASASFVLFKNNSDIREVFVDGKGREQKPLKHTVRFAKSKDTDSIYVNAQNSDSVVEDKADKEKLFPNIAPLTEEEMSKFKLVPTQIVKYFDFGKMDTGEIDSFRQLMWSMGERAIATVANKLNSFSSKEKADESTAKEMISYIDFLRYLSLSPKDWPMAIESIEKIAKRPVVWNDKGELQDHAVAGITFECFELYASTSGKEAEKFILELDDNIREPYVYHYILGRKLANIGEETVLAKARETFGEDLVNKAFNKI